MKDSEDYFLKLLENKVEVKSDNVSPSKKASLYIISALLNTVIEHIKEQHWLSKKEDTRLGQNTSYEAFINRLVDNELPSMVFLKSYIISAGLSSIENIHIRSLRIEEDILSLIKNSSGEQKKEFLIQALSEMTNHFVFEENSQVGWSSKEGHRGPCLYRTFDNLDVVLDLHYQLDRDMAVTSVATERLYERAGVGVQSGFSTILLALHETKPKHGAKVIDLGSGYGRVGLVYCLLRDDIEFIGYEFVPHRVENSNQSSLALGLDSKLKFITQDLSLTTFIIPSADFYYLYDPFTKKTYEHFLKRIVKVSKDRIIKVVTKGNAREWLGEVSKLNKWPAPKSIDKGNLCLFSSC